LNWTFEPIGLWGIDPIHPQNVGERFDRTCFRHSREPITYTALLSVGLHCERSVSLNFTHVKAGASIFQ